MKVNRTSGSTGAWIKKEEVRSGTKLKIMTEAQLVEGQNGSQLVAKVRLQGSTSDVNASINNTSKNALIDAYGDDTADWVNKVVTVETEKALIAGKRSIIMYLVPEGYGLKESEDGFMTIARLGAPKSKTEPEYESTEDTREAPLPDETTITADDVPW
jgi:hypothetical protein